MNVCAVDDSMYSHPAFQQEAYTAKRKIVVQPWLVIGLVATAVFAVGVLLGVPSITPAAGSLQARQPPPIPTVSLSEWDSVPPSGLPKMDPIAVMTSLVSAEGDSSTRGASASSATTAITIDGSTGATSTAGMQHGYVPSAGDKYIKFLDHRVVLLPQNIELTRVLQFYTCWEGDPCGIPPLYVLEAPNGATVRVDGNGAVYSDGTGEDSTQFPFLQNIFPQDPNAPGRIVTGAR